MQGITKDKEGNVTIAASHDIGFEDPMTGTVHVVKAGDVAVAGIDYAIRYGVRQSGQDSRAGIKDKADADLQVKARIAAIKAGTVKEGSGGRKADEVANEAVETLRSKLGMGRKAFKDAFGTGRDAINKVCAKEVNEAVAAHIKAGHDKPSKEAIAAKLSKTIKAVMDKAQARVDERKGTKIDISF